MTLKLGILENLADFFSSKKMNAKTGQKFGRVSKNRKNDFRPLLWIQEKGSLLLKFQKITQKNFIAL